MKQKITIKVQVNCDKSRREAMKTASKQAGVFSIEMQGEDKDRLVVVGDGVDSVELTKCLRKKVGHSKLISVEEVKEKKKEPEKKEPEKNPCDHICPRICYPPLTYCEVYDPHPSPCSVM